MSRNVLSPPPPAGPPSDGGVSSAYSTPYSPSSSSRSRTNGAATTREDSRRVAQTHFSELSIFLESHLRKEAPNARTSARDKLTRLTRQQFQELSTDVYDELCRRLAATAETASPRSSAGNAVPFLPVKEEFHPKRNQARQKLATLPKTRFKDLASDVYFELVRRYPELVEKEVPDPTSPTSARSGASPPPANGRNSGGDLQRNASNASTSSLAFTRPTPPSMTVPLPRTSEESVREALETLSPSLTEGGQSDYYDKMSMRTTSVSSGKGLNGSRRSYEATDEIETLRRDYEYRIATMQSRITQLESESSSGGGSESDKVRNLRQKCDEATAQAQSLRRELSIVKAASAKARERDKDEGGAGAGATSGEAAQLRRQLEDARTREVEQDEAARALRNEIENLLEEVRALSAREDERLAEEDRTRARIRELESEVGTWKKRYEAAKTELRNLKATSQLFVPASPTTDDHLPATDRGGITGANLTSLQSAVDDLLQAGRSSTPSSVLNSMKAVVLAVTAIQRDVEAFERDAPPPSNDADASRLSSLKSKLSATLTNLHTAARNHAMGGGISPVSLLDAAASHLSTSVIDLARLLGVRKGPARAAPNANGWASPTPVGPRGVVGDEGSDAESEYDARESRAFGSEDGRAGGTEEEWEETKTYVEAQSDQVTTKIEAILSAARVHRGGVLPNLNDNLTTIITITTSIVAICEPVVPRPGPGPGILAGLAEKCDVLSGFSGDEVLDAETRKKLSSSIIGIAGGFKELLRI